MSDIWQGDESETVRRIKAPAKAPVFVTPEKIEEPEKVPVRVRE